MAADDTMLARRAQAAAAEAAGFDDQPLDFGYEEGSALDGFTSLNDPSADFSMDQTVSPNDLSLNHNSFSRPQYSTTFTNLTTPDLLDDDSPFMTDSLEVSPAFESGNFGTSSFTPLFPTDDYAPAAQASKRRRDVDVATPVSAPMSRNVSSRSVNEDKDEHELLRQRLAMTAGIPKSTRRATKVLEPIEVDEEDERAVKRRKNTLAARKSRQKKVDEVMLLQARILELEKDKNYWKMTAIQFGAPIPENETPSPSAMSPQA